MAHVDDESGHNEVYVLPFPGPGGKQQIPTEGGGDPVWAQNGQELFYLNGALLHGSERRWNSPFPQAVASGDAFEHRPSECGHCVPNFLADLDFRDLPGEAAGFELGADDTLPTADLRFYPAALVVPCG